MVKKMWAIGIGVLFGFFLVAMIFTLADAGAVGDAITNVISMASSALFGVYGNALREANLISRGFEKMDSVIAANADNANALFLKAAPAGI